MIPLDHKQLLYSIPVALVVTDERGMIRFVNRQGQALLHVLPDHRSNFCDFFSRKLMDYEHRPAELSLDLLVELCRNHPDQWLVSLNGSKTYVHLELEKLKDKNTTHYVWTITPLDTKNLAYAIRERVKEQVAVVKVIEAFFDSEDVPTAVARSLVAIQRGWQFPYATSVRIRLQNGEDYATDDFRKTEWLLTEDIATFEKHLGVIEVCYSVEIPALNGSVFLQEEVRLIRTLAQMLGILIDHCESAEKVRADAELLKKITQHVPANTYQFEILPDGSTRILFMNKGTETFNLPLDKSIIERDPSRLFEILHESDKEKCREAVMEAYRTESELSIQYRIALGDNIRWRWLKAVPEKTPDGKTIWYGASQDITLLVQYITSVEQILFDISHMIGGPVASILGITKYMKENDLNTAEMRDITRNLVTISEELDFYIQQLNNSYEKKRKLDQDYHVDFSPLVDNRDDLFGKKD